MKKVIILGYKKWATTDGMPDRTPIMSILDNRASISEETAKIFFLKDKVEMEEFLTIIKAKAYDYRYPHYVLTAYDIDSEEWKRISDKYDIRLKTQENDTVEWKANYFSSTIQR